jgi:hypothetical protein
MFCVLNGTKFVCFLASSMGPRDPVARVNFVLQLMKTVGQNQLRNFSINFKREYKVTLNFLLKSNRVIHISV